eukprot:scaffold100614_cov54-Attheya_sp.AAC.1
MGEYACKKKSPQVLWFSQRVSELVSKTNSNDSSLNTSNKHTNNKDSQPQLTILDVGGGRGDLAFGLLDRLSDQIDKILLVDTNESSLLWARKRALELGYEKQMEFIHTCISKLDASAIANVNVVVGLHACGGLTDAALALVHRIASSSSPSSSFTSVSSSLDESLQQQVEEERSIHFFICPCCFHRHVDLVPTTFGWCHEERMVEKPSKNENVDTLKRLAESSDRTLSLRAMTCINSLRLAKFKQFIHDTNETSSSNSITVKRLQINSFSKDYSMRNLVLEGHLSIAPKTTMKTTTTTTQIKEI